MMAVFSKKAAALPAPMLTLLATLLLDCCRWETGSGLDRSALAEGEMAAPLPLPLPKPPPLRRITASSTAPVLAHGAHGAQGAAAPPPTAPSSAQSRAPHPKRPARPSVIFSAMVLTPRSGGEGDAVPAAILGSSREGLDCEEAASRPPAWSAALRSPRVSAMTGLSRPPATSCVGEALISFDEDVGVGVGKTFGASVRSPPPRPSRSRSSLSRRDDVDEGSETRA